MSFRLLYVIGTLDLGGAEQHLLRVLPKLQERGCEPSVFTTSYRGEGYKTLEVHGIRVLEPPFAQACRKLPRGIRQLALTLLSSVALLRLLWVSRYDFVHFFLPEAYLIGGLVSLAAPVKHRIMSRRSLNNYQHHHAAFLTDIEKWLHHRMSAVLGNSLAVTDQLRLEGVGLDKLGLIYNSVEPVVSGAYQDRLALRAEFDIGSSALVLVIVANLIPYKGHEDLIAALACTRANMPEDWVLLCIGEDRGIGTRLVAQAEEFGLAKRIRWLGRRRDVCKILRLADMALLVSHEEGFSNALLEYMSAGLPIIATDVGGNAEAVVDQESGIIVPPRKPALLASAIIKLANDSDLRARLGSRGQVRVEELFSMDRCVSNYMNLYQSIMQQGHVPLELRPDGKR